MPEVYIDLDEFVAVVHDYYIDKIQDRLTYEITVNTQVNELVDDVEDFKDFLLTELSCSVFMGSIENKVKPDSKLYAVYCTCIF